MFLKRILHRLNQRSTRFIPNIPPRFKLLFLFFLAVAILVSSKTIFADNIIKQKQDAIKDGSNQEAWLDEAMGSNMVSGIRTMMGDVPDDILNGKVDPNNLSYIPSGALGSTTQLISSLYNPPVSGIEYMAQIKDNFLGKPAYAQGIGFNGLMPLINIWRAFRNIVYILSSLIFLTIGLMIILRIKISPQAVIGIQNMIPQIVFTLILVTFSYAIAGFLIDLVYFVQAFFIAILFSTTTPKATPLTSDLIPPNIFSFLDNILHIPQPDYSFKAISNPGMYEYFLLAKAVLPTASIFVIGSILGAVIGTIIGSFAGGVIGLLSGGTLIILILQVVILVALLKFFFGLIKAYVIVIIKVITAPLEIGAGAFPNSKLNFSSWFADIIAHLAVFPISIIFIVLLNLIVRSPGALWAPSLLNVATLTGVVTIIPAIIGLGGILLLPKLPDLIPQLVFQIKPSPWGSAIGQSFKETAGPFKAGGSLYLQNQANAEAERYKSRTSQTPGQTLAHSFWDVLSNYGFIRRKP